MPVTTDSLLTLGDDGIQSRVRELDSLSWWNYQEFTDIFENHHAFTPKPVSITACDTH